MARATGGWKLRRKGGRYYVRFTDAEGRRWELATGAATPALAAKEAKRIYTQATSARVRPERHYDLQKLIEEWLAHLEDTGRSEQWINICGIYATAHWLPRWKLLGDITQAEIDRYISDRQRGNGSRAVTPTTLRKELSAIRRLLTYAAGRGLCAPPGVWTVPRGKSDYRARVITPEEAARIIAAIEDPRDRAYYAVMWSTALRRSTMDRLTWEDVDLGAGALHIRPSADKARYDRQIPLSPAATAELAALRPPDAVGLIWGRVARSTDTLRRAARMAGIDRPEEIGHHTLRHSRLTHLARHTRSILDLQYLAGHRQLSTTQRYLHPSHEGAANLLEIADRTPPKNCGEKVGKKRKKQIRIGEPEDA